MRFLAEPASALTDAALGAVSLGAAATLARRRRADPVFVASIATMGAAAAWGAAHHALVTPHPRAARRSWTAIAGALSSGIGLLFVSSARATLTERRASRLAPIGGVGPAVYAALAVTGRSGLGTMVAAQALSMVGVVGLWIAAAARGRDGALLALSAVAASAAAASAHALPAAELERIRLDRDSAYHLAQIPGVIVLALAAEAVGSSGPD